jgi:hypothetical protein
MSESQTFNVDILDIVFCRKKITLSTTPHQTPSPSRRSS